MEWYQLGSVFAQAAARHGIFAALLTVAVFCALALAAYYLKTRIDLMRERRSEEREKAQLEAQARVAELASEERDRQAAAQARAAELAEDARERQALIDELKDSRAQIHSFLTNHLEHLRIEREAHASNLGELAANLHEHVNTLKVISHDLKAHRLEESSRAKEVYQALGTINTSLVSCPKRGA